MNIPSKEFIDHFKSIPGALSVTESIAISNIASMAPKGGVWVEGGTHKGKSAASALYGGSPEDVHLIDTEFEKTISIEEVISNVSKFINTKASMAFIVGKFADYLKGSTYKYSFVFSDAGLHDDEVLEEVKLLEDKLIAGGIICFHDFRNQFTAVERAYNYLLSTGRFEEIIIDWEPIIKYVRENNLEEGNTSWHIYSENPFPNFVGALRRK